MRKKAYSKHKGYDSTSNQSQNNNSSSNNDIVLIADKNTKLLDFLFEKLANHSKTNVREMLKSGRVVVAGIGTTAFDFDVKAGVEVRILPKPKLTKGGFFNKNINLLYEDNYVIVINKREGLLSVGTNGDKENTAYHIMNMYVRRQGRGRHIFVVHRLDRKTSGVMMFAKNMIARDTLRQNWNEMVVERSYYAVIEGSPERKKDVIKSYLTEDKMLKVHSSWTNNGGQLAVTQYEIIQENDKYALAKLNLDTGRKNQIRSQMAAIGHPVVGDLKYDAKTDPIKRVCLHAATLTFRHPATGKVMKFEVPVPQSFYKLVTI
ncbi:MAG: RluA family pseudouridine synthase [Bacteroidales bacterium]|nr:RluA family pseudouridine synthase [Bacteroidales bacterium]